MKNLILQQIENYKNQVLFMNFIYALLNILSLGLLAIIFNKIFISQTVEENSYLEILKAFGAILAPYLAFISKGFLFPMWRKLDTLYHLLFKSSYTNDEISIIYDKA